MAGRNQGARRKWRYRAWNSTLCSVWRDMAGVREAGNRQAYDDNPPVPWSLDSLCPHALTEQRAEDAAAMSAGLRSTVVPVTLIVQRTIERRDRDHHCTLRHTSYRRLRSPTRHRGRVVPTPCKLRCTTTCDAGQSGPTFPNPPVSRRLALRRPLRPGAHPDARHRLHAR